jgi:medium-chain acyl-[acyl-carrier-protein] hydrolase
MRCEGAFDVHFFETDRHACLTPVALFNYMQEVAIRHGEAVGMSPRALHEAGYVWMMNRIHLRIDRYPVRGDIVHVRTWATQLSGMYAIREWVAFDANGERVARATGRWVLLDGPRRKIIRIPAALHDAYGVYPDRALEDSFERMQPLTTFTHERAFHVRLSDLDTNQHANSAVYMDWTLESVPNDILDRCIPHAVELTYKKECKLGEPVAARSISMDSSPVRFRHEIRHGSTGEILCLGVTYWRNRTV